MSLGSPAQLLEFCATALISNLTANVPLSVGRTIVDVAPSGVKSPRGDHATGDDSIGGQVDASPMDSGFPKRLGRVPVTYRIVVRGEVTERFAEPLEGVVVESAGDRSVLRVEIVDQAKLQGTLSWLYDHGIDLVSVNVAEEAADDVGPTPR
jgi:hypothetical protein